MIHMCLYLHQIPISSLWIWNTMINASVLSESNSVITVAWHSSAISWSSRQIWCCIVKCCVERVWVDCCYWELEWSGDYGVHISVSYKSISRKGWGNECVFGYNDQSWSLFLLSPPDTYSGTIRYGLFSLLKSIISRIGVFVDHGAGTLSFYSISDTMSLIHTVQTTFTQPLYPGFRFGSGSSVKLISVDESE